MPVPEDLQEKMMQMGAAVAKIVGGILIHYSTIKITQDDNSFPNYYWHYFDSHYSNNLRTATYFNPVGDR